MNNQFDELTKTLAKSVTRRAALKKFSLGLAGMALACFGLPIKAEAGKQRTCKVDRDCGQNKVCALNGPDGGVCLTPCNSVADCQGKGPLCCVSWPTPGYFGVCDICTFP